MATAPTGLTIASIRPDWEILPLEQHPNVCALVSVDSWGTDGVSGGYSFTLSVCESQSLANRSYYTQVISYPDNQKSAFLYLTNDSSAMTSVGITMGYNQRYYLTAYATNGAAGVGNTDYTEFVMPFRPPSFVGYPYIYWTTLASQPVLIAQLNYYQYLTQGVYTPMIQHRYKKAGGSWSEWVLETDSANREFGTFYVAGLEENAEYTVEIRTAGVDSNNVVMTTSNSVPYTFTATPTPIATSKLYGSVNGNSKQITKLYGSVNGQAKLITKLYGSVNGVTKRIY